LSDGDNSNECENCNSEMQPIQASPRERLTAWHAVPASRRKYHVINSLRFVELRATRFGPWHALARSLSQGKAASGTTGPGLSLRGLPCLLQQQGRL